MASITVKFQQVDSEIERLLESQSLSADTGERLEQLRAELMDLIAPIQTSTPLAEADRPPEAAIGMAGGDVDNITNPFERLLGDLSALKLEMEKPSAAESLTADQSKRLIRLIQERSTFLDELTRNQEAQDGKYKKNLENMRIK